MRSRKCNSAVMLQINSDRNRNTLYIVCLIRVNCITVGCSSGEGTWLGRHSLGR